MQALEEVKARHAEEEKEDTFEKPPPDVSDVPEDASSMTVAQLQVR